VAPLSATERRAKWLLPSSFSDCCVYLLSLPLGRGPRVDLGALGAEEIYKQVIGGAAYALLRMHLLSPLGKAVLLPSSGSTQTRTTFGIFFRSVIEVSGELKVEVAL
jgi:hypothetical protein